MLVSSLGRLLADLLSVLSVHIYGSVSAAEALFTLPGLWATWRLWGPLRDAAQDMRTVRRAADYWPGCPEELIAAERRAILRFFLAVVLWIDATGLLYMLQPDRAHTAEEHVLALVSILLLVGGLLGLAVGIAVLTTRLSRAGPRLLAAMREARRRAVAARATVRERDA